MKLRFAALAIAALGAGAGAQDRVTMADLGPGMSGRILQEALRKPHRLAGPDSARLVITREVQVRSSLIVLGRSAQIEGAVEGDVIVVDGDLFVRTGARVNGRIIAIGGGTYPSALAYVGGEQMSFRDNTFHIEATPDGYRLTYQSLAVGRPVPLLFPGTYGLRGLQYDRVNGLSIPFGPAVSFAGQRGEANLLVTGRTDLGVVDPSLAVTLQFTRRGRATLDVRRGSFSNDAWIWPNIVNSLSVLALGEDTRNFHRADAAEFALFRLWEFGRGTWEPFIGARHERAWSVGPAPVVASGPWSAIGRTDTASMWRPNPPISPGVITSALFGASYVRETDRLTFGLRTRVEASLESPGDESFQQVTTDVALKLQTVGDQEYAFDVHAVSTLGDTPPPQRFVHLGGPGTLPFHDMLSIAGDQLLLVDQRYSIPLTGITLGWFGNPSLQLRHRIGAAGLGSLPSFAQMVGVGLSLTVIRFEVQIDPDDGRMRGAAGFTFSR